MERGSKTILLVEDEIITAMFEKRQLENAGYVIAHALSGEQAVKHLNDREQAVDLILMDIDLGNGMDGPSAAREILACHDIPLLFLSSHTEKEIVDKTEKITNYGYVVKNSGITVLDASIKMAFKLFAERKTRIQNEQALKESESRLRLVFENSGTANAIFDSNFKLIVNNAMSQAMLKLTKEQCIGKSVKELFGEEKGTLIEGRMRSILQSGKQETFESEFKLPVGPRWVRTIYQLLMDADSDTTVIQLVSQDITERKQAEDALVQERSMIVKIMETSPVGIATVEADGRISYANAMAEQILGLKRESITSRDYNAPGWKSTDIDGNPLPDEKQPFSIVKATLQPAYDVQHCIVWPNGKRVLLSVNASPLKGLQGEFQGMVATFDDITDRKNSERMVRKLLAEKELILKEVHHRVKNNMNTMSALLMLQSGMEGDAKTTGVLMDAASRIQSMMVLYDRLYRSDNPGILSTKDYFPRLIEEIAAIFPTRTSVKVETRIEDIQLEPKLLSPLGIIINELITNSMKYAFSKDEGLIRVSVALADGFIRLEYADDGIGLPASVSFENSGGFGMQLIKMLVDQLCGTIRIERGAGTKFVMNFSAPELKGQPA